MALVEAAAAAGVWERAGQHERAATAAYVAVEMDPKHGRAQLALARAFSASGNVEQAVGRARIAWEIMDGHAEVGLLLGSLYERREEFAAAYEIYAEALEKNPGDPRLRQAMIRLKDH